MKKLIMINALSLLLSTSVFAAAQEQQEQDGYWLKAKSMEGAAVSGMEKELYDDHIFYMGVGLKVLSLQEEIIFILGQLLKLEAYQIAHVRTNLLFVEFALIISGGFALLKDVYNMVREGFSLLLAWSKDGNVVLVRPSTIKDDSSSECRPCA